VALAYFCNRDAYRKASATQCHPVVLSVYEIGREICGLNTGGRSATFAKKSASFSQSLSGMVGHAVAQWLRHCATNHLVAGSIPDGVTGIFH
jgi:hypothetical protein